MESSSVKFSGTAHMSDGENDDRKYFDITIKRYSKDKYEWTDARVLKFNAADGTEYGGNTVSSPNGVCNTVFGFRMLAFLLSRLTAFRRKC